jgi:ATP-dependent DNA helicase RecG
MPDASSSYAGRTSLAGPRTYHYPGAVDNLEAVLKSGESSFVEFKDERVHPDSLAREMAAFANTEGGAILLGVGDDGSVSGLTRPDVEE